MVQTVKSLNTMQETWVFWPEESHGQKSLVGYSPIRSQRVRHD